MVRLPGGTTPSAVIEWLKHSWRNETGGQAVSAPAANLQSEGGDGMKQIGFIGLGTMGAPMAENLLKGGYQVTVYNRTSAKTKPLEEAGAAVAATPQAAAQDKDVIITMISNDDSIREVFRGERYSGRAQAGCGHY